MLENWLSPIEPTSIIGNNEMEDFSFYHSIQIHTQGDMPSLKGIPLAIIGLDDSANDIRKQLYRLSWHFNHLECVDLGNIRKNDDNFITQVLTELIDGDIFPIILGGESIKPIPQFLAHKGVRKFSNLAIISEMIPFSIENAKDDSYIVELLNKYSKHIFNLSFLAYQTHYCDPQLGEWLSNNKYDGIRLGVIKSEIEEAEPIIRDADMLFFQLDSLKQSECPGVKNPSPNGLLADEACQLSRYAGMSDKLGSFSLSGYSPEKDIAQQTTQIAAQMIWYFIEGFCNRKYDYPVSNSGMTEYVVDYKDYDYQLTFWKSQQSGRWWMQIPLKKKQELLRHRLIPCSYNDYKLSCSGELPERLMLALDRFN